VRGTSFPSWEFRGHTALDRPQSIKTAVFVHAFPSLCYFHYTAAPVAFLLQSVFPQKKEGQSLLLPLPRRQRPISSMFSLARKIREIHQIPAKATTV
jgi:hypothetical protein